MLADALCGDREARDWLVRSMYGSSRPGHRTTRGVRWAQLTRRGIESRHMYESATELVATWAEIRGHLDGLPGDLGRRAHDAYAAYQRLRVAHGNSVRQTKAAAGTYMRGLAGVIEAEAKAAVTEYMHDVLAPLLDQALTYQPPDAPTQPDIFDLLAEVP